MGRATRVVNAKSDGTTISSFDYTHEDVGNPTLLVEANGDRVTWAYDALGQASARVGA